MSQNSSQSDKSISFDMMRKITENPTSKIHFVGIGGVSMYSLARLAMLGSAGVTGSDREISERTKRLSQLGARIYSEHNAENVRGADLVVYSHAIAMDNAELVYAKENGIPTASRAEYLGAMMQGYKNRIGVSGSHGKSTTVAMLDSIMSVSGSEPTVLSGAELSGGEPLKLGSKGLMIYESCEYKDSFLKFSPTISIGLNLELDHTDYFESLPDIQRSFKRALGKATDFAVINGDDANFKLFLQDLQTKVVTFGAGEHNLYRYEITSFRDIGCEFSLSKYGSEIGRFALNIPGSFNVSNATAAIVTALEYGVDVETAREAISKFSGVPRRLEYIGQRWSRAVYYDYAHHPTEILASVEALKMLTHEPLTVIFKPHTYTRTKALWREFVSALKMADYVILTDIYPARETAIEGVTSERLACEVGSRAVYCPDDKVTAVLDRYTKGTIVIMGAGDMEFIKKEVLK